MVFALSYFCFCFYHIAAVPLKYYTYWRRIYKDYKPSCQLTCCGGTCEKDLDLFAFFRFAFVLVL